MLITVTVRFALLMSFETRQLSLKRMRPHDRISPSSVYAHQAISDVILRQHVTSRNCRSPTFRTFHLPHFHEHRENLSHQWHLQRPENRQISQVLLYFMAFFKLAPYNFRLLFHRTIEKKKKEPVLIQFRDKQFTIERVIFFVKN